MSDRPDLTAGRSRLNAAARLVRPITEECGATPEKPGRRFCEACNEKHLAISRRSQQDCKKERRKAGLCVQCGDKGDDIDVYIGMDVSLASKAFVLSTTAYNIPRKPHHRLP